MGKKLDPAAPRLRAFGIIGRPRSAARLADPCLVRADLSRSVSNAGGPSRIIRGDQNRGVLPGDERGFVLHDERVESEKPYGSHTAAYFFYQFQNGHPVVSTLAPPNVGELTALKEAFDSASGTHAPRRGERKLQRCVQDHAKAEGSSVCT